MSVLTSDRDTAKLYVQNNTRSKHKCKNKLINIRDFEAAQKTRNRVIIRCKNPRLRVTFLNLIIYSCSFFKQYLNFIQKRPYAGRYKWQLNPWSHESDLDQRQFSPNNFST